MSELPKGWASSTIGNLFSSFSGGTPSKSNPQFWGGDIPWVSSGDVKHSTIDAGSKFITQRGLEASSAKFCRIGSVIIVVRSGILKHTLPVALVTQPITINQDLKCLDSGNDDLNKWLLFSLKANQNRILAQNRGGTTVQSVTSEVLNGWVVDVPPLNEQRRIVEKLDEVMGRLTVARTKLERVPRLLTHFRRAVLSAACSGALTRDWREKNSEEDWEESIASEACDSIQSGSTPRGGKFQYDSGIPFLKVYNIVDQKIDFAYKPQFIDQETHQGSLKRALVKPGDVLMNIVGPPLGKVAIVPDTYPEWNINQAIVLFRPSPILDAKFLYLLLCSGVPYFELLKETRGSAGQSNISLSQCRDMTFNLPPLTEQLEIVRRVNELFAVADSLEARFIKAKAFFDRMPAAILAKAFRGELVPQDPDDEPAALLLQRLASARDVAAPSRKTSSHRGKKKKTEPPSRAAKPPTQATLPGFE